MRGNAGVQNIQRVFITDFYKLKIMVMIQQLNARVRALAANVPDIFKRAFKRTAFRAAVTGQIRHRNIAATDSFVGVYYRLRIGKQLIKRDMRRYRHKAGIANHTCDILGGMSVQAGEFHTVIPHAFYFGQHRF
ncbi:hypothetical protein SDC9_179718 [bioreactor metagenome]|uniref:Uncharacterized protein n=1 Tax=bioreactor metagenome TaxID=1076179 RepID=A0A645H1M6_9ZZZZ